MYPEAGRSCTLRTDQSSLSMQKGKFLCPETIQSCILVTNQSSLSIHKGKCLCPETKLHSCDYQSLMSVHAGSEFFFEGGWGEWATDSLLKTDWRLEGRQDTPVSSQSAPSRKSLKIRHCVHE